jgi:uncharacterized membrane protein YebE (DUF533 family)
MEKLNFSEILLRTAVCAIACDGDVDEREKEMLFNIEKKLEYFSEIDLSSSLEKLINDCTSNLKLFMDNLFKSIDEVELNIVEELTLLEVSFRIIAADDIEQRSEQDFIINLSQHLDADYEIIRQRFGTIDYLEKNKSEFRKFDTSINIESVQIINNKK